MLSLQNQAVQLTAVLKTDELEAVARFLYRPAVLSAVREHLHGRMCL